MPRKRYETACASRVPDSQLSKNGGDDSDRWRRIIKRWTVTLCMPDANREPLNYTDLFLFLIEPWYVNMATSVLAFALVRRDRRLLVGVASRKRTWLSSCSLFKFSTPTSQFRYDLTSRYQMSSRRRVKWDGNAAESILLHENHFHDLVHFHNGSINFIGQIIKDFGS